MFKPRRSPVIAIALCLFWGCSDTRRAWNDSLGTVEVVEAPPPDALESVPLVPLIQNVPLEQIYLEPPPLPLRHVVQVALFPAGARRLEEVQRVEVTVDVEGGAYGSREVSVVFVSPQGLVWERQATRIEGKQGTTQLATFWLPVASTFIDQQRLSGHWQLNTLDQGVEQASATFALEE